MRRIDATTDLVNLDRMVLAISERLGRTTADRLTSESVSDLLGDGAWRERCKRDGSRNSGSFQKVTHAPAPRRVDVEALPAIQQFAGNCARRTTPETQCALGASIHLSGGRIISPSAVVPPQAGLQTSKSHILCYGKVNINEALLWASVVSASWAIGLRARPLRSLPGNQRPLHVDSSRPECARSGHSRTAWQTRQIDPKRTTGTVQRSRVPDFP